MTPVLLIEPYNFHRYHVVLLAKTTLYNGWCRSCKSAEIYFTIHQGLPLVRLSEEPYGAEKETRGSGMQRSPVAAHLTAKYLERFLTG
jgi:hypothetical protein